jgi:hypothetical protein
VTFGTNLIINGDAEAANLSDPENVVDRYFGWNSVTYFPRPTVLQYDIDGYLTSTDPGPVNRGNNFFAGAGGQSSSRPTYISQNIDLFADISEIDTGNISYDLSGWLGGNPTLGGLAQLVTSFFNADGGFLGSDSIQVNPSNLAQIGLLDQNASGSIPIGARSINVELYLIASDSDYVYADNLSLVLTNNAATSVPEPSAVPGILIGGALVVGAIKKRKRKL